jgi:hypothetical protein
VRGAAGYGPAEAAPLLRDFSLRWQAAIEAMHRETVRQFADAGCGREVLQVRQALRVLRSPSRGR